MTINRLAPGLIALLVVACASAQVQTPGSDNTTPRIEGEHFITADGTALPYTHWDAEGETERVVLALHGFNDFRLSHQPLARWLQHDGNSVYAYDQRGFGATEQRGIWAGEDRLVDDAMTVLQLLKERYPDKPAYLVGESMGAGVVMLLLAREDAPEVAGAVLMAPAVWGRDTQPWYQRLGLWLGIRVFPGFQVDTRWVDVDPSDDPDVLRYWDKHPLVIRDTRVDALEGVTELMGRALEETSSLPVPALIVYGGKDEVVPGKAICLLLEKLPDQDHVPWRFAYYPDGWHLLARDSRSPETLADIGAWLSYSQTHLPSGRELDRERGRAAVCEQD